MVSRLEGRRVLLVEDVISTGGTVLAELELMEKLGCHVVGVITAIKETNVWQKTLGKASPAYPALVHAPISCPLFRKVPGGWAPDMATMPD
jgi:adenine/guanine phosphoribosyltransferase-like PRPP-binding protein